jgi:hypothetical protein
MRIPSAVLLGVLLAGLTLPAAAQPSWDNQLAVTGGAQFATGSFGDAWKTGTGLAVTYYSRPSSRFFFGARVGYQRFKAQTGNSTLNVIPLHFASKYNFALTGVQPYLGVDGGLYLLRPDGPDNTSEFGVAPKFGLRFPLASGVDLDVNATYEVILNDPSNQTYLGVNAGFAYIFGG